MSLSPNTAQGFPTAITQSTCEPINIHHQLEAPPRNQADLFSLFGELISKTSIRPTEDGHWRVTGKFGSMELMGSLIDVWLSGFPAGKDLTTRKVSAMVKRIEENHPGVIENLDTTYDGEASFRVPLDTPVAVLADIAAILGARRKRQMTAESKTALASRLNSIRPTLQNVPV